MADELYAFPRFGELMTQLVDYLVARKFWTKEKARIHLADSTGFSVDMVYRWSQGRSRPPDEALNTLARIGKWDARLKRPWGEALLSSVEYPHWQRLVAELWPSEAKRVIPHNLPTRVYAEFIGRDRELEELLTLVDAERAASLIPINGSAGVGKTTLAVEGGYRCLSVSEGRIEDSRDLNFSAIIFISAQEQMVTSGGIVRNFQVQSTLRSIFHTIGRVLGREDITRATPEEQPQLVFEALTGSRKLLILDNAESIEDKQNVMSFLYSLPLSVKVIITTREKLVFYTPLQLEQLPLTQGVHLIRREAREKAVAISNEQAIALYEVTGGIPAAIIYAVGQLATGYRMEAVLRRIVDPKEDIARFFFETSILPLRNKPPAYLLMAIAIFAQPSKIEAAYEVAGLAEDPIAADDAVGALRRLTLIHQVDDCYQMLPLTREYCLAELAKNATFEALARQRWIDYYLNFAATNGGDDWDEWHLAFDRLEKDLKNILAVIDWCTTRDRYDEVRRFWQQIKNFTHCYGQWDSRLLILKWLIEESQRRGDRETFVEAVHQRAWTLTILGKKDQLAEAADLLQQAWAVHEEVSYLLQSYLADAYAEHLVRQAQHALYAKDEKQALDYCRQALIWINQSRLLLNQIHPHDHNYIRKQTNTTYYEAIAYFRSREYQEAEKLFEKVRADCEAMGWQRLSLYAQNWLADVAIERGTPQDLLYASQLLRSGLPTVERNKDRRRAAFYKWSLARLEEKQGNIAAARNWVREAVDIFQRLGMLLEVEEMEKFAKALQH